LIIYKIKLVSIGEDASAGTQVVFKGSNDRDEAPIWKREALSKQKVKKVWETTGFSEK
jgi:hypothetical protein